MSTPLPLLLILSLAGAAEYHVNNRHKSASDTNPGTIDLPLKHIQAAADKVQPGDTVTVHGGTYRELIIWKTPGIEGKRITLQAKPGDTVVVKGSVVVKGWEQTTAGDAGLIGDYPHENIWVKRGWIKEAIYPADEPHRTGHWSTRLLVDPRWAFWKDAPLKGAGWLTFAFRWDELQEGRIHHNAKAHTLTIWLPPGIDPNTNGIEVCVRSKLLTGEQSYMVVRGIQWRHSNTRNLTNHSAVAIGTHSLFENNIVSWCDYIGMWLNGEKSVLRNNTFAHNGAAGVGGIGKEHLIEDNKVLHNNLDRHDTFNDAGGGKWIFLKGCTFRRHEAAYNIGPGLWLDIDNTGNVIESSYFHHNHGAGLFIEISSSNLVRNCIFAFNTEIPAGMRVKYESHNKASTKARHRHYQEHGDMGWGAYNSSTKGTKWLNNLFYANQNAGLVCEGEWRGDGSVPNLKGKKPEDPDQDAGWSTTKNLTIKNNIFAGNGGIQLMIRSTRNDKDCVNNVSDYNLFEVPRWTGASIGSEGYGGPRHSSLSAWQKATGWDKNSLAANSELTLPAGGDFRPTLISPAADRGVALSEVKKDYNGRSRPVGKGYDIGPFERYSILSANASVAIPADLKFHSVNLKSVLNRKLADDKAEDGTGGWADQGPACDFRDFTTMLPKTENGQPKSGSVKLAGIDFQIEYPLSMLVLNPENFRPGKLPDKATINVGRNADWLFLLHATAWSGSWDYIIHYKDETTETIKMTCPANMRDWTSAAYANSFRFEKGTITKAAWTGKTNSFPTITIYRTAWPNPKPSQLIVKIEMLGRKGVPGLLAMTVGEK